MKLKFLRIENLFSHKLSQIDFEKVDTIALLMGTIGGNDRESNGSGKTTIIEAILYALYEKTRLTENKNATLDDMVRWNSNGKLLVEFQFEIDGLLFRIIRTRDKNKGKGTVTFETFTNNQWKNKSGANKSATNKEIITQIGIDYDTFCSSICFQQSEVDKFISAGETQRKNIIKNILQLDKYDEYRKAAKAKAQAYDVQLKALEKQIESIDVNILDVEAKQDVLNKVNNRIQLYETEKKAIESQIEKLRTQQILFNEKAEKRISLKNRIKDRTLAITRLEEQQGKAITKQETYKVTYKDKQDELKKLIAQFDKIKDQFVIEKKEIMKDGKVADKNLKQSETELEVLSADYHKLAGEVENIIRDVESIKTLKEARCPTCYGEISKESKDSSVQFLKAHQKIVEDRMTASKMRYETGKKVVETNKKALDVVKERLQDYSRWAKEKLHLQDTIKLIKETVDEAEMIIADQKSIIKENSTLIVEYKDELEDLDNELKGIKIDVEKFEELNSHITEKNNKLTDANRLLTEATMEKGRLQVEIRQYKESLARIKQYRKEKESHIREKFYYDQLDKIFGKEIPSLIIENTCFELGEEANKVLRSISNDSIEFVTQRPNKDGTMKEVFEIEISRPGVNHPILIDNLSNGQKFRVVFAIRIALSRLLVRRRSSTTMDFLFYDECFASLDEKGIDDVIDVFRYLREEFTHQLIITHRTDLKERFGNNVIMVKQDQTGVSRVAI